MALKLITFDITGTILRFRSPPHEVYASVAKQYGLRIAKDSTLKQSFRDSFKDMGERHPNFGRETSIGWSKWWLHVVKSSLRKACDGASESQLDIVAWHLIRLYSTFQPWEVCPGALDLLENLKSKGLAVGVISNFDPRVEQIICHAGIGHYFNFVIASYNAGFMKPDRRIFDLALSNGSALANSRVEAYECCHVGDTYATDYIGAVQSGWKALLLNESSSYLDLVQSEHLCKNMDDIVDKLGL